MKEYPAFSSDEELWIAPGDDSTLNKDDYRFTLESLSNWIAGLTNYVGFLSERDLAGEPADVEVLAIGAMTRIEKTIQLCAHSQKIISQDFIQCIQKWLKQGREQWRVIIPTVEDDWITIYATFCRVGERINPTATDLEQLAMRMKDDDPGLR